MAFMIKCRSGTHSRSDSSNSKSNFPVLGSINGLKMGGVNVIVGYVPTSLYPRGRVIKNRKIPSR
jgi:hypothetical protein